MEKINLSGVNETLLIPLCARALETQKPNPLFRDESALRILKTLDYDFRKYENSKMNMWGCAARTVLFDDQTKKHIALHPDCSVINIACGLDDRFSRVDNGRIHWYNVDFSDVIDLRAKLLPKHDRVTDIACSAFDYSWMDQVENKAHALVIAEGFLMYVEENQVKELFTEVSLRFTDTTLLLEMMGRWMVEHQKLHEVNKTNHVSFHWGVKNAADFCTLVPAYDLTEEFNFTDGMKHFAPIRISLIAPMLRKMNNMLGVFHQK